MDPLLLRHPLDLGRVRFLWTGDRYVHIIQFLDDELRCADRFSDADWPDSPPVQQLSIEPIGDHLVALGVGCAGKSHWSVSVEPTEVGFRFDWACRARSVPERLGTAYQPTACQSNRVESNRVETVRPSIQFTAEPDAVLSVEREFTCIAPQQPFNGAGTYRWGYRVQCK